MRSRCSSRGWRLTALPLLLLIVGMCFVVHVRHRPTVPSPLGHAAILRCLRDLDPNSRNPEARQIAEDLLASSGSLIVPSLLRELKARPALGINLLRQWSDRRRYRAVLAFDLIGDAGRGAIPELRDMMTSSEYDTVAAVATILARMGADGAQAAATGLKHTDVAVRRMTAIVLYSLGDTAGSASKELLAALQDSDQEVTEWAGRTLAKLDGNAEEFLPVIAANLAATNAASRYGSVVSLGVYGKRAAHLSEHIAALADDPDVSVREAVEATLSAIMNGGSKSTVEPSLRASAKSNGKGNVVNH